MNTRSTSRSRPLPRRAARTAALTTGLLLALSGTITGCASTTKPEADASQAVAGRPALNKLRSMALTERPRPTEVALPPGLDLATITPAAPADPDAARKAALPLEQAIAEVQAAPAPDFITAPLPPAPTDSLEERQLTALRLFASGRESRLQGQNAQAIADLEAAAQLDPTAPEVRLELAEANLAAGKRLAASAALERAAALNSDTPRVFWLLAVDAVRSNNAASAAWLLLRARGLNPQKQDPALPYLIDAGLADALGKLGYAAASAAFLEAALDLPDQLPSQTIYRLEYAELIRRQADASRDLGDARLRLGDFDGAIRLYDQAAELPSLDPGAILARRLYARVRSGRPAGAALLFVETVESAGGLVEERQIPVVTSLLGPTTAAAPLAAALLELQHLPTQETSARSRSGLIRAAAALSPATSRTALRELANQFPDDRETLRTLLTPSTAADRAALISELSQSSSDPLGCIRAAAEAIVDSGVRVSETFSALDRRADDASVLLLAQLNLALNMPVPALESLKSRTWTAHFQAAGAESVAFASASAGSWETYAIALATLENLGPGAALSRCRALLAGQRFQDAFAASEAAAAAPNLSVGQLVTLARAAQLAGKPDIAAQRLAKAIELDRFDERGYEGLLSLYAPSGQPLDNEKLTQVLRSLRQNVPSSRLVRWFSAQDMVQRGSLAMAERSLLELAEEDPGQASLINVLSAIWERSAQPTAPGAAPNKTVTDAEAWLKRRLAIAPESIPLRVAMARLQARTGEVDEALSTCDLSFGGRTPPELLRTKELIFRQTSRAEQADALAAERRALTGAGIDASIDLAEAAVNAARFADASAALARGIPAGVQLSPEQITRILAILTIAAQNNTQPITADELTALFSVATSANLTLSPQLHEARLRRLAASPDATFDQIGVAALLATRQYPALGDIAYRRAAQTMIDAGKRDRAAAFLVSQLKLIPDVKDTYIIDTFALTANAGDEATINALLDALDKPEWIDEILMKSGITDDIPEELDKKRCELAYVLGVVLNDASRDQLATLAYRRALAINPDHPWANNNLGYQIAEAHGDLREAEAMLRRAVVGLPEEGSILDSLGWILYKQGRLADEKNPDGTPLPGALSLLALATTSIRGSENPTILDHYGDALYSSGKADDAKAAWTKARQAARNQLQMLRLANANNAPSRSLQRLETLQASISAKLDALEQGKNPPLAEQPGLAQPSPTK